MNSIAYIVPTIDRIGGAERQVLMLATEFQKKHWDVSVITLSGDGGAAAMQLQSAGVAFHSLHMKKGLADPRGWLKLHRWVTVKRPDIIHAHLPHASILARMSRLAAPVRVVVDTIHSPATGGTARKLAYQASARLVDAVTAVSHAAAEPWLRSRIVSKERLSVIPNGVDTSYWKADAEMRAVARRKLGVSEEFLWIAVGRLDPVKNHATLLRAFASISPPSRLLIAGCGPLEERLRTLARKLGIQGRLTLTGFEPEVRQWMQAADGFVLCSFWEGLPLALLEAGACELPAIITDIAGAREALPASLRTIVPTASPDALAQAMRNLMCLPEAARRNLGKRMRASVEAWFGVDSVIDRWEDFYFSLLNAEPYPSRIGTTARSFGKSLQHQ